MFLLDRVVIENTGNAKVREGKLVWGKGKQRFYNYNILPLGNNHYEVSSEAGVCVGTNLNSLVAQSWGFKGLKMRGTREKAWDGKSDKRP